MPAGSREPILEQRHVQAVAGEDAVGDSKRDTVPSGRGIACGIDAGDAGLLHPVDAQQRAERALVEGTA